MDGEKTGAPEIFGGRTKIGEPRLFQAEQTVVGRTRILYESRHYNDGASLYEAATEAVGSHADVFLWAGELYDVPKVNKGNQIAFDRALLLVDRVAAKLSAK